MISLGEFIIVINMPLVSNDKNTEKIKPLRKTKTTEFQNAAGWVWLSVFMDGSGKCKLPGIIIAVLIIFITLLKIKS